MSYQENDQLIRLGKVVAAAHDAVRPAARHREQVRQAIASAPRPAQTHRQRRAWYAVIPALIGVGAVTAAVLWWPEPLPRLIDPGTAGADVGHEIALDQWLTAPQGGPLVVKFADGTAVNLTAGATARVTQVRRHGGQVVLGRGRVKVDVVHRFLSRWEVSAGPYTVKVTGTRFVLRWSPKTDELELRMLNGEVWLSGCRLGTGLRVRAGERLRASCKAERAETDIIAVAEGAEPDVPDDLPDDSAVGTPAPSPQPDAAARPAVVPERRDRSAPGAAGASEKAWHDLAKDGRYAEALASARPRFAALCRTEPTEAVLLLGDAARLAGALSDARQAFYNVRRRAPRSAAAAAAAFSLGRLEFDQSHDLLAAAEWFRVYLREQHNGPFAREARGRLMETLALSGDDASARTAAQDYLLQHGDGPHAATARAIVARPSP